MFYIHIGRYKHSTSLILHKKYLYDCSRNSKFTCNLWIDRTYFVRMKFIFAISLGSCCIFLCFCFVSFSFPRFSHLSPAFEVVVFQFAIDHSYVYHFMLSLCRCVWTTIWSFFCFQHFIYVQYYLSFALNATAILSFVESPSNETHTHTYILSVCHTNIMYERCTECVRQYETSWMSESKRGGESETENKNEWQTEWNSLSASATDRMTQSDIRILFSCFIS